MSAAAADVAVRGAREAAREAQALAADRIETAREELARRLLRGETVAPEDYAAAAPSGSPEDVSAAAKAVHGRAAQLQELRRLLALHDRRDELEEAHAAALAKAAEIEAELRKPPIDLRLKLRDATLAARAIDVEKSEALGAQEVVVRALPTPLREEFERVHADRARSESWARKAEKSLRDRPGLLERFKARLAWLTDDYARSNREELRLERDKAELAIATLEERPRPTAEPPKNLSALARKAWEAGVAARVAGQGLDAAPPDYPSQGHGAWVQGWQAEDARQLEVARILPDELDLVPARELKGQVKAARARVVALEKRQAALWKQAREFLL